MNNQSGLDTTEEEFLKIDKTLLASVLLEEDPLKYPFLQTEEEGNLIERKG
jgi:hypothetical protein